MSRRNDIRNVAIIAHVDHGKTTLVDGLLQTCRVFRANQRVEERVLDSMDQERERGITIMAKNIALTWAGVKVNLIDTPGHADFGGEVERVLGMADGCLLLVDAFEGPMPQTRFVLRKAFLHGLRPFVIVNKVDRPDARPARVLDEVFDLFCELDAEEDALEFPHLFVSARDRLAKRELTDTPDDLGIVLDDILAHIPGPEVEDDARFRMKVATIGHDPYTGRVAIGRVLAGSATEGEVANVLHPDKPARQAPLKKLFTFDNLGRVPTDRILAGDIVAVTGVDGVEIGDTLAHVEETRPLPVIPIDEPTLAMVFSVNDGPFGGQEGEYVTSRHIRNRLLREAEANVALRVSDGPTKESMSVAGRGVMHLGVLIEAMRREGYEFCVSPPEVIEKTIDGKRHEPIENLVVEVPSPHTGKVMEIVGLRRGELIDMATKGDLQELRFSIPARGLIGLRSRLMTATQGEAVATNTFRGYAPFGGEIPGRNRGVMIATETNPVVGYALFQLADRGAFFVKPGDQAYGGMVVGEHCRPGDLEVNVSKRKHLTNIRAAAADDAILLAPPKVFSLEEALEYIQKDELLEVTPKSLRLRKRFLDPIARRREFRRARG